MMKISILLCVILVSLNLAEAKAFPALGDTAVYASWSDASSVTTTTFEITAVDVSGGYTKRDTVVSSGETLSTTNIINAVDAKTTTSLMQAADSDLNCQKTVSGATNGSTAIIETKVVAGAQISVCHIHFPGVLQSDGTTSVGDLWFGNVPFALVAGTNTFSDGRVFTLTLTSFVVR